MTKQLTALFAFIAASVISMTALDVAPTAAGSLHSLITAPAEVTELSVAGPINAYDLDFIDSAMPLLKRLDLSDASIEASSGRRLRGISTHAAGHFPARIFTGTAITELQLPRAGQITIGDAAFAGAAIESITLGANVITIGAAAFSYCQALTAVTLSTSCISEGAFAGCSALESVTLAKNTSVADHAFDGCSRLSNIIGAEHITAIGRRAFADCTALTEFAFGPSLTAIGDEAFIGSGLHSADISPCTALTTVGHWAFAQMPALEALDLGTTPALGTAIAFDCPALKHINLPKTISAVPDLAYAKDIALDTIGIVHENVTHIGSHALHGLTQVATFTLPASLEYIGDGAMEGMTGLEHLNISATTPPATGEGVWSGLDQAKIALHVPAEAVDAYSTANQWQDFSIYGISGAIDALNDNAGQALRARFEGDILAVEATGLDILRVSLYDVGGRLIRAIDGPLLRAEFNTAGAPDKVFLIGVVLTDRRSASLKIAK